MQQLFYKHMLLVSFYIVKSLLLAASELEKEDIDENICGKTKINMEKKSDIPELLHGYFNFKVLPDA